MQTDATDDTDSVDRRRLIGIWHVYVIFPNRSKIMMARDYLDFSEAMDIADNMNIVAEATGDDAAYVVSMAEDLPLDLILHDPLDDYDNDETLAKAEDHSPSQACNYQLTR